MINWKSLAKHIPIEIQTSKRHKWSVVFVKDFKDGNTLGETRFDSKQIAILMDQPPKITVITYLHEVLHAVSMSYNAELTEKQVLAVEKAFLYLLKKGNLFKE